MSLASLRSLADSRLVIVRCFIHGHRIPEGPRLLPPGHVQQQELLLRVLFTRLIRLAILPETGFRPHFPRVRALSPKWAHILPACIGQRLERRSSILVRGHPMLVPEGVSIKNTIRVARMFSSPLNREAAATAAFGRGAGMDFQRTHSTLRDRKGTRLIDQRFIAIGNYNFGVYAAASGMSLATALSGDSALYATNITGDHSGPYFGNPRNSQLVVSGYRDYLARNVGE
jgi:hypothetical protein